MKKTFVLFAILGLGQLAPFAGADAPQPKLQCGSNRLVIDGLATWCEMREIAAVFAGSIDVDSSPTGAISVRGWDEPGVLIRAQVQSAARDEPQAVALAAQVLVTASAGVVRSAGPSETPDRQWSVSYEIFLPRSAGLNLKAAVGAVAIQDVMGRIRCATSVGALQLVSLHGDVVCQTSVGAISIVLDGDHWDGTGLDVQTNVGAIELNVPAIYSAHLELSTGLGSITSGFALPVVKNGLSRSVSADLGAGGAPVRAATKVGAVAVQQAGDAGRKRKRSRLR